MKEIIRKAKKILITTKTDADFDHLAACISLAHTLNQKDRKISLAIPADKYSKQIFDLFPTGDLKIIQKNDPDSFILSLPKDDAIVKDVKWKEEEGNIEIYITTEKGSIPTDRVTMQPHRTRFDLLITIDVDKLEEIGEFYKKNAPIFTKNKIISIARAVKDFAGQNFIKNNISSCANVFEFIVENTDIPDEGIVTDLLAGLLWKTNGLRYDSKGTTSSLLGLFIKENADFQTASKKAFQNTDLSDIRLIDTVLKNLSIKNSSVAYASIKNAKSKGISPEKIRTYDWFVFDSFKAIESFFVLFEIQDGVLGYLINRNSTKDAREFSSIYKAKGNKYIAKFHSNDPLEKIQKNLLKELGSVSSKDIAKSAANDNQIQNTSQMANQNPLAPAVELPQPLELEDTDDGFIPPPPIQPLE
ncbi:hypothetical protein JW978_02925 [Candidatus Dojkabacteria bacterium]|nr:hypothetical protein [Candidatus Dojkabacteria bacterium]